MPLVQLSGLPQQLWSPFVVQAKTVKTLPLKAWWPLWPTSSPFLEEPTFDWHRAQSELGIEDHNFASKCCRRQQEHNIARTLASTATYTTQSSDLNSSGPKVES